MLQSLGAVSACDSGLIQITWRGPCPFCANDTDSFGVYFERASNPWTPPAGHERSSPMEQTFTCHPMDNADEPHDWMRPITPKTRKDMSYLLQSQFRPVARVADRVSTFWGDQLSQFDWVLGIHIRATDYNDLGSFGSPPLAHYVLGAQHLIKQARAHAAQKGASLRRIGVFVASDNEEAITLLQSELSGEPDVKVVSTNAFRATLASGVGSERWNPVIMGTWREALTSSADISRRMTSLGDDILTDVLLLSRCHVMLHWESAVARLAALWQPNLTSVTISHAAEYPYWSAHTDFVDLHGVERAKLESCYKADMRDKLALQYGDVREGLDSKAGWAFDGGVCWTGLSANDSDWECDNGATASLLM